MRHEVAAISIAGRRVATDLPPFVVAELSATHDTSLDSLLTLVDGAAAAGAHGVKVQALAAGDVDERWLETVAQRAALRGLKVVAAATSVAALVCAERVGVDAYRFASRDLDRTDLIRRAAASNRPLILSTAACTLDDVRRAVATARRAGARAIALLHGVSAHPVPKGSENLLAIRTLATSCQLPVGLSDHGADTFAWPLAVGLGASLYERRLSAGEPRSCEVVASSPAELAAAVRDGRRAWLSLGSGRKAVSAAETASPVPEQRRLHRRLREAITAVRPAEVA